MNCYKKLRKPFCSPSSTGLTLGVILKKQMNNMTSCSTSGYKNMEITTLVTVLLRLDNTQIEVEIFFMDNFRKVKIKYVTAEYA